MKKSGILLINLGTPAAPKITNVRKYLKEFLSDPRVIDIPAWARWLLVTLFILPFRPKQSAKAYSMIWEKEGSPLLIHSQNLKHELVNYCNKNFVVALGMRYGKPSIFEAIHQLKEAKCDRIIILPLFPQYSSAATGSALEETLRIFAREYAFPELIILNQFYDQAFFINAFAVILQDTLNNFEADHILFSYHGLPERHIDKSNCIKQHCNREAACPMISNKNYYCYRAQCFATTQFLAHQLNLQENNFSTSFQSRLGRTPWIKPYTDEYLAKLITKGIKNLLVVCPSFVADCLETLEEIGIRAKEQWLELGGKNFLLAPSLNTNKIWVKNLADYLNSI